MAPWNSNRTRRSKRSLARGLALSPHWVPPECVRYQELKWSITTSLALLISTTLLLFGYIR